MATKFENEVQQLLKKKYEQIKAMKVSHKKKEESETLAQIQKKHEAQQQQLQQQQQQQQAQQQQQQQQNQQNVIDDEVMPEGWSKHWSKSWNQFYYFNAKTREQSWTPPAFEPIHPPPPDGTLEDLPEPSKEDMLPSSASHETQGLPKAVFDVMFRIVEKEQLLHAAEVDKNIMDTLRQVPVGGALMALTKFRKVDLTQIRDRRTLLRNMVLRQAKFRAEATVPHPVVAVKQLAPEVNELFDRLCRGGQLSEGQLEVRKELLDISPQDALVVLKEFEATRNVRNPPGFIFAMIRRLQSNAAGAAAAANPGGSQGKEQTETNHNENGNDGDGSGSSSSKKQDDDGYNPSAGNNDVNNNDNNSNNENDGSYNKFNENSISSNENNKEEDEIMSDVAGENNSRKRKEPYSDDPWQPE